MKRIYTFEDCVPGKMYKITKKENLGPEKFDCYIMFIKPLGLTPPGVEKTYAFYASEYGEKPSIQEYIDFILRVSTRFRCYEME